MKKSFLWMVLIGLVAFAAPFLKAQERAGQAGEFLRYGVHARALGMGRAYTGLAEGAGAIYWNPGGLADLSREGISFTGMLTKLYANTSYNYLGVAIPLEIFVPAASGGGGIREIGNWNIGLAYLQLSSGGFEERTDANFVTGRTFSDVQRAVFFTLNRGLYIGQQKLGFGATVKLISQNLFQQKASASAIDLGLTYFPESEWFRIGLVAKNVNGPNLAISGGGQNVIPMSVRTGVALTPQTGSPWLDAAALAADYEIVPAAGRTTEWYLGFEYDLLKTTARLPLKLRFGTNSSSEVFTFGLNFNFSQNSFYTNLNEYLPRIDWAYLTTNEQALGQSAERLSFDFNWTPLTAAHWYLQGIEEFKNNRGKLGEQDFAMATVAKNPKFYGYPIAAYLRLGDIALKKSKNSLKGLVQAAKYYEMAGRINQSSREIDPELNQISFLNYLQGLILEKKYKKALKLSRKDFVWVNHPTGRKGDPDVQYLQALALYNLNKPAEAEKVLAPLKHHPLSVYLLSRIYIDEGKFQKAKALLDESIRPMVESLPPHIYLPYQKDHLIQDDLTLLKAYVDLQLAGGKSQSLTVAKRTALAAEFLNVPRYFPFSETGALFSAQTIQGILNFIERGDQNVFEKIFEQYKRNFL